VLAEERGEPDRAVTAGEDVVLDLHHGQAPTRRRGTIARVGGLLVQEHLSLERLVEGCAADDRRSGLGLLRLAPGGR